jgi:ectoine hydroxylase-related dioxygenase (phytanoyl-CoA dioxygenase family)
VVKATRAAVRDAQRERDEAKVKRAMLIDAQREVERARAGQGTVLERIRAWRASIDQADFAFKRDVLEVLAVRVAFRLDEVGRRVVEVSTLVSLAKCFEYVDARAYQKRLWERGEESPW